MEVAIDACLQWLKKSGHRKTFAVAVIICIGVFIILVAISLCFALASMLGL